MKLPIDCPQGTGFIFVFRREVIQLKSRKEVQDQFGITRKTLIGYKEMGLLYPTQKEKGGRWYYDDEAVEKLKVIQVYTEAGFSRKRIKQLLNSPNLDLVSELDSVIHNLEDKRKRIDEMINIAIMLRSSAKMPKSVLRAGRHIDLDKLLNGRSLSQALREDAQNLGRMSDIERMQLEESMPFISLLVSIGLMKGKPYDSESVRECIDVYNRFAAQAYLQEQDEDFVKDYGESSDYEKSIVNAIFGVGFTDLVFEGQEVKEKIEQQCGEGSIEYIVGALEAYGNSICEEEESFTEIINEIRRE